MSDKRKQKGKISDRDVQYWTEVAILDFTEELSRWLEQKHISRAELAKNIGSSPAYITKVLRGNVNFTLETMTKLSRAVGAVLHTHLAPENAIVEWNDTIAKSTQYSATAEAAVSAVNIQSSLSDIYLEADTWVTEPEIKDDKKESILIRSHPVSLVKDTSNISRLNS